MTNFIYDNTALPGTKTTFVPRPDIPADQKETADEFNTVMQAMRDVQAWARGPVLLSGEAGSMTPGTPIYVSAAATMKKAKADSASTGRVLGLTINTVAPATSDMIVTAGDIVRLTTVQWDAVCGTTGGLAFDVPYYLSAATAGMMTSTPPNVAGQVVQQVIVGVSPTEALVKISDPEVLGSGDNVIQLRNDNDGSLIIGTPVYSDAAAGIDQGLANNSGKSTIIGLVSDVSVASGAQGNVAVGGLIVASTAQWDAICGTTGGLTFNVPYYLHKSTPGRLTATAPTSPGDIGKEVVQVITALSETEARIAITTPILL